VIDHIMFVQLLLHACLYSDFETVRKMTVEALSEAFMYRHLNTEIYGFILEVLC
jgi:hypothetical protein